MKYPLKTLVEDSRDIHLLNGSKQVGACISLMRVMYKMREKLRSENESRPVISDKITKDFRFKAGAIWALNEILSIPDEADKLITDIEET